MGKGKRVAEGTKLIDINAKVRIETKSLLDAVILTNTQGIKSKREFIEMALELYAEKFPADIDKAKKCMALLSGGLEIYGK